MTIFFSVGDLTLNNEELNMGTWTYTNPDTNQKEVWFTDGPNLGRRVSGNSEKFNNITRISKSLATVFGLAASIATAKYLGSTFDMTSLKDFFQEPVLSGAVALCSTAVGCFPAVVGHDIVKSIARKASDFKYEYRNILETNDQKLKELFHLKSDEKAGEMRSFVYDEMKNEEYTTGLATGVAVGMIIN